MSTLLLDPQLELDLLFEGQGEVLAASSRSSRSEPGRRLTLGDVIAGVWEGLSLDGSVACPACGGTMQWCPAARAERAECACGDCGASLS
ncbi:MAG TPA: hypothetical protein VIC05_10170 [Solirubrobacteraceae bacterium]|jgi:hypothetical protein